MSRCIKRLIAIALFILTVTALCVPVVAADASHHHRITNGDVCLDCGEQVYECKRCGEIFSITDEKCPFCKEKREAVTVEEKQRDSVKGTLIGCIFGSLSIILLAVVLVVCGIFCLSTEKERYAIVYFITAGLSFAMVIVLCCSQLPFVIQHRDLLWH